MTMRSKQQQWTSITLDARHVSRQPPCTSNSNNDQRVRIYLSIYCLLRLHILLQLQLQSNVCLFVSLNSPLSSRTMSTRPLSRALPTRPSIQVQPEHHSSSNTYNRNAIRQWQWQSWHTDNNITIAKNADRQQSFIINNNFNTFAIKSIAAMTAFPPSATWTL